ncbi:hypothetical protein FB45DRAFT_932430 [Roridomyces roridus]|uniref:Uncharacterized protein n=1 Tax=Roridomyces roridus TaxID=1738132 RepID=A0AAD7FGF6_9AGAR|nr:hypothetical protein FB45DRAFT_932430 [Roridomyces roridus]
MTSSSQHQAHHDDIELQYALAAEISLDGGVNVNEIHFEHLHSVQLTAGSGSSIRSSSSLRVSNGQGRRRRRTQDLEVTPVTMLSQESGVRNQGRAPASVNAEIEVEADVDALASDMATSIRIEGNIHLGHAPGESSRRLEHTNQNPGQPQVQQLPLIRDATPTRPATPRRSSSTEAVWGSMDTVDNGGSGIWIMPGGILEGRFQ